MDYQISDIIDYVNEEDVKFIRLTFTDIFGTQKNISIMPNLLNKAFEKGICIDSLDIPGYEEYRKIVLHPDPSTTSLLPWRPSQGRVIKMFCDITDIEEKPIESSPRKLLKDAVSSIDIDLKIRNEYEFYLTKLDFDGNDTGVLYDSGSLYDIAPLDKGENIRRAVCLSLSEMDVETIGSVHAKGSGQNKILYAETEPVKASETAVSFMSTVRTISASNGLFADFSHNVKGSDITSDHRIVISVPDDDKKYLERIKTHISDIYAFITDADSFVMLDDIVEYDSFDSVIVINGLSKDANPYIAYTLIIKALIDTDPIEAKAFDDYDDIARIARSSDFVKKNIDAKIIKRLLG